MSAFPSFPGRASGGAAFGRKTGNRIFVSADGYPLYKVGGVSINWAHANFTVANGNVAPAGGIELADGTFVEAGVKYLRYGSVLSVPIDGDGKQGEAFPAVEATALVRDRAFVTNETVVQGDYMADHAGGPFHGGRVYKGRLRIGAAANVVLPTEANLRAACPDLIFVED